MIKISEQPPRAEASLHPVILFDGICPLCVWWVRWILSRDPAGVLHFAPLQSDTGSALLEGIDRPANWDASVLLLEDGQVYSRTEAVLRVLRHLEGMGLLVWAMKLLPRPLRDRVYDWIGTNRYRWFGRLPACMLPDARFSERFLDLE